MMYGRCQCGCGGYPSVAPRTDAAKGWVKDCPKPYLPQHGTRKWRANPKGCWIWSGHIDKYGYGRIRIKSQARVAHRVYYEAHYGAVPNGRLLFNNCGSSGCVNPKHWSVRMEDTVRHCAGCYRDLPIESFRVRTSEGYRSSYCEPCRAAHTNHARRARLNRTVTDHTLPFDVWLASEGECHICHKPWLFGEYGPVGWHVDHIQPLSRGGTDLLDNKAVACAPCNSTKWAHIIGDS